MKHSVLFAILCTVGLSATAQSSVTLSGQIKLAITKSNSGTTPLDGYTNKDSLILNDNFSTWGLHGKEDLGGGLYAGFDLVSWITPDTGALGNPGALFHAKSVVKLGGSFGELYMGRALTPVSLLTLFSDPWYWDGSAAQLGWQIQQANYLSTAFIRTNNTVGYNSPNLGGLTFSLAGSPSEKTAGGKNDYGFSAKYAAGPLTVGLGYDQNGGNGATFTDKVTVLTGAYDFGVVKPMFSAASSKVKNVSYKSYSVALTAPLGANGLLKAGYGHLDDFNTATVAKEALQKFSIGYQHSLSKRTNLFAQASQAKAQTRTATNTVELGIDHSF